MLDFSDFNRLTLVESVLNEVQMQFNKNRDVDFGNAVILAGGAGSGKGFVLNSVIGMQGKVFDVDALKSLAMKAERINKRVMDEYNVSLKDMNLGNADNVYKLHTIIGDELNLPKKQQQAFFASVIAGDQSRKPNIIFDVTLKDMKKFDSITRDLRILGYDKKKIHLVWIINDIDIAVKQNSERERKVPEHILINTHTGVNTTLKEIVNMGESVRQFLDGDIFFTFNKKNVDNEYVMGKEKKNIFKKKVIPGYMKKATYIQMKEVGKAPLSLSDVSNELLRKIDDYTPDNTNWGK